MKIKKCGLSAEVNLNFDILEIMNMRKYLLFPNGSLILLIANEYTCGDDVYMGWVEVTKDDIIFLIEIKSRKKNELIKYKYFK